MKNKNNSIKAVNCTTIEELRSVFDKLHATGYNKEGLPLFNVFVHESEFNRGMRYVMIYSDSKTVKVAASVPSKNKNIQIIQSNNFN